MSSDAVIWIYLLSTAVSLVVLYVLIRFGVKHGTASALREHEIWLRDGSLERAQQDYAERADLRARLAAQNKRDLDAERS